MFKFKINDKVIIRTGKDKGKIGIIKKLIKKKRKKNTLYVLIDGINFVKKHLKANPNKNKTGGITSIEKPISFSNIMLINTFTHIRDKIYFTLHNKKKTRVFKSNKELLK